MLSELGGCLPKFYYFCTAYRLIDERRWGLWKIRLDVFLHINKYKELNIDKNGKLVRMQSTL